MAHGSKAALDAPLSAAPARGRELPLRLTASLASRLAQATLAAVCRDYPHKLDHVLAGPGDLVAPARLHPAFHGSFDWHSAVHGHWMLARLLRQFPRLPEGPEIRAVLDRHLAPACIQAELDYLLHPAHRGFERPYGWAWLLKPEVHNGIGAQASW